jgi:transposase
MTTWISSGPTEGTNPKSKTMERQAYGFRDRESFKSRIPEIPGRSYASLGEL